MIYKSKQFLPRLTSFWYFDSNVFRFAKRQNGKQDTQWKYVITLCASQAKKQSYSWLEKWGPWSLHWKSKQTPKQIFTPVPPWNAFKVKIMGFFFNIKAFCWLEWSSFGNKVPFLAFSLNNVRKIWTESVCFPIILEAFSSRYIPQSDHPFKSHFTSISLP